MYVLFVFYKTPCWNVSQTCKGTFVFLRHTLLATLHMQTDGKRKASCPMRSKLLDYLDFDVDFNKLQILFHTIVIIVLLLTCTVGWIFIMIVFGKDHSRREPWFPCFYWEKQRL